MPKKKQKKKNYSKKNKDPGSLEEQKKKYGRGKKADQDLIDSLFEKSHMQAMSDVR